MDGIFVSVNDETQEVPSERVQWRSYDILNWHICHSFVHLAI